MNIVIAGCGALGSYIATGICHHSEVTGFYLIDDDTVGEENLGTSAYWRSQVGMPKAVALAELIYWMSGKHVYHDNHTLEEQLRSADGLVVDTFDNPVARALVYELENHTLHSGVNESRMGVSLWDIEYPRPNPTFERANNPVCTNQLGAKIIRLTSTMAIVSILRWLETGQKLNFVTTELGEVYRV